MRAVVASAVVWGATATACSDDPTPTDPDGAPPASCLDGPVTPLPSPLPARLTPGGGPWLVRSALTADSLAVEAGTVLCFEADARIEVDALVVTGSSANPVRFTAAGGERWGGIVSERAFLRHATVERAAVGVSADSVDLEAVLLRQLSGPGLEVGGGGSVRGTRLDTVCTAGPCAGISAGYAGTNEGESVDGVLRLTDVVVQGSGGDGISAVATVALDGVRLDGIAGTAIVAQHHWKGTSYGDLRVEGGVSVGEVGGYLIDGRAPAVSAFMDAFSDSLRSGHRVSSWGDMDRILVPPGVSWEARALPESGEYCVYPGEVEIREDGLLRTDCLRGGSLVLAGTREAPARLETPTHPSRGTRVETLVATYASIRGGPLEATEARLENVDVDRAVVVLSSGARVERLTVAHGGVVVDGSGVVLREVRLAEAPGHGIVVRGDSVAVRSCVVTGSHGDGVRVEGARDVVVAGCDLVANEGAGVAAEGVDGPVDARGNWWGDPAGAEAGDGLRGPVVADDPLPGPAAPPPVVIEIRAAAASVTTGDTVRLFVEARDASGLRVLGPDVRLEEPDGRLAFPVRGEPHLAVGRTPGAAAVTAVSRRDPSVRGGAVVVVEPGAPYVEWTSLGARVHGVVAFGSDGWAATSTDDLLIHEGGRTDGVPLPAWLAPNPWVFGSSTAGTGADDLWHWRTSANDLEALGHWNGSGWEVVAPPEGGVRALWAPAAGEVFARGTAVVSRWDGTAWTEVVEGCAEGEPIVPAGPSTAYLHCRHDAAGGKRILHFDGTAWRVIAPPPLEHYEGLFVGGDGSLRIVGPGTGAVLEDGVWRTVEVPRDVLRVSASAPFGDGAFVVAGSVWYVTADDAWRRAWVPGGRSGPATLARSGDALLLVAEDGELLRGEALQARGAPRP